MAMGTQAERACSRRGGTDVMDDAMAAELTILTIPSMHPKQINPWSGWFHHTLYTAMVTHLVQRHLAPAFVIFGILEAPTLLMALGAIYKPLRNDKLFGGVFFATRLAFHVYLTLHLAFAAYPGTLTFLYPLGVLPLHVMWFNGWIKQQKRIHKAKLAAAEASKITIPAASPLQHPVLGDQPAAKPAAATASTSSSKPPTAAPSKRRIDLLTRTEAYKRAIALKERLLSPATLPTTLGAHAPTSNRRPHRHSYYGGWPTSATVPPLVERRASVSAGEKAAAVMTAREMVQAAAGAGLRVGVAPRPRTASVGSVGSVGSSHRVV
ncbi:hypothetical protein HDU96_010811 [Phlyctochytrium bullatum]|nr:hypothetical protein HDU96_010811 [Phlyctochytrium bullatum]